MTNHTFGQLNPSLMAQLHPSLNKGIQMSEIYQKSSVKLWWVCQQHGHPYVSTPRHKAKGAGCGVCAGKQVHQGFNDLATTRPEIVPLWHSDLNEAMTVHNVTKGYRQKVWWKCPEGHEWDAKIANVREKSCPVCSGSKVLRGFNDALTLHPHLENSFHPTKNDITLDAIPVHSRHKIWWNADCGHEVEALVSNCLRGIPCGYCKGQKVLVGFNDLATTDSHLVPYWDHKKNSISLQEARRGKSVYHWKCGSGHEWELSPIHMNQRKNLCRACAGTAINDGINDLMTLFPHLLLEWDEVKNAGVSSSGIFPSSDTKYWWKCSKGHSWDAAPQNRGKKKTGCPDCAGTRVTKGVNTLADMFPSVSAEWHPTKNGILTPSDVHHGSNKFVFWACDCGNEWKAKIADRTRKGSECPQCVRFRLPSFSKSIFDTHPLVAAELHPSKNGKMTAHTLASFSNRTVWWKGQCGHEWTAQVAARTDKSSGCPSCWKAKLDSNAELELVRFVESLGCTVERSNRKILDGGRELDLYLADYNLAIEYNGLFWHSQERGKDKEYHRGKLRGCQKEGIRLIMVWEDDWLDRPDFIKSIIRNAIAVPRRASAALHTRKIPPALAKKFHNLNGVSSEGSPERSWGVYEDGVLSDVLSIAGLAEGLSGENHCVTESIYSSVKPASGHLELLVGAALKEQDVEEVRLVVDASIEDKDIYEDAGFVVSGIIEPELIPVANKKRDAKAPQNPQYWVWDCGKIEYRKHTM